MQLLDAQLNCLSDADYAALQQLTDLSYTTFKRFPALQQMLGPVAKAASWSTLLVPVINKTGSTIAAKKAVGIAGFDVSTGRLKISLTAPDSPYVLIGVTNEPILDGATGYIRTGSRWFLNAALNTGSSEVGDPVYLGASGALQLTAPASGAVIVLGLVSTVETSGQIVVIPPVPNLAGLAGAAESAQADATQALADAATANTALGNLLSGTLTVLNGQTTITQLVGAAFNGKPVLVSPAASPTAAAWWRGAVAGGALTLTIDADNTADLPLYFLIDGR